MEARYKKIKILGKGTFGVAVLVNNQLKQSLVVKQINLQALSLNNQNQCYKQAKILRELNHPNIIKFKEVFLTKQQYLCIVTEYASLGTLTDYMNINSQPLKQSLILTWVIQICLALKYIHNKNIVHRDIKPTNIFLSKNLRIKIGDFGLSDRLKSRNIDNQGVVGSPNYMSPQILCERKYNEKCDIWALGVVIYFMCTRRLPFQASNLKNLIRKISSHEFIPISQNYSKQLKELIKWMLSKDDYKRPTAEQILNLSLTKKQTVQFFKSQKKNKQRLFEKFIELKIRKRIQLKPRSKSEQSQQNIDQNKKRLKCLSAHKKKECKPQLKQQILNKQIIQNSTKITSFLSKHQTVNQ